MEKKGAISLVTLVRSLQSALLSDQITLQRIADVFIRGLTEKLSTEEHLGPSDEARW